MRDSLYIGSTPADEDCESLGADYDPQKARFECQVYAAQLVREHGRPPEGARLRITSNPHDFGDYLSVNLVCDTDNQEHMEYYLKCEGEGSNHWDDKSLSDLKSYRSDID